MKNRLLAVAALLLLLLAVWLFLKIGGERTADVSAPPAEASDHTRSGSPTVAQAPDNGSVTDQAPAKSETFKIAKVQPERTVPTATPSAREGRVISPYPPYQVINVSGLESGTLAYDPSTIPIDPETGKPYVNDEGKLDLTRAKTFIVP